MLDWLRDNDVPHTVVATKIDKVKSSQRQTPQAQLAGGCRLEPGDVVWVSAAKGINLDQLRGLVVAHLARLTHQLSAHSRREKRTRIRRRSRSLPGRYDSPGG